MLFPSISVTSAVWPKRFQLATICSRTAASDFSTRTRKLPFFQANLYDAPLFQLEMFIEDGVGIFFDDDCVASQDSLGSLGRGLEDRVPRPQRAEKGISVPAMTSRVTNRGQRGVLCGSRLRGMVGTCIRNLTAWTTRFTVRIARDRRTPGEVPLRELRPGLR